LAIVWQKNLKGTSYEIRKAGNTTRLYTDGVFHSQFNPDNPITRSVWDLLMLPAFFYVKGSIKRVLVLGVGGGSVIQLLHKHVQPEEIIGIELNPVHISVAKRFFGVNNKMAKLYAADAISWMEKYKGPPFDMIIDDLFGEVDGEGVRPIPLNAKWKIRSLRFLRGNQQVRCCGKTLSKHLGLIIAAAQINLTFIFEKLQHDENIISPIFCYFLAYKSPV